jgi:anti-sigma regulatory factor (Ser/Thr protein kinase)
MNREDDTQAVLRLTNDVSEIDRLARWAARFLAEQDLLRDETLVHDLQLCLEEIVTNVIKYAFNDHARHEILVRLAKTPTSVVAVVEDDGIPFDPLEHPRPNLALSLSQTEPGGLGIQLVREYMDELRYAWRDQRNCLIMTRSLA